MVCSVCHSLLYRQLNAAAGYGGECGRWAVMPLWKPIRIETPSFALCIAFMLRIFLSIAKLLVVWYTGDQLALEVRYKCLRFFFILLILYFFYVRPITLACRVFLRLFIWTMMVGPSLWWHRQDFLSDARDSRLTPAPPDATDLRRQGWWAVCGYSQSASKILCSAHPWRQGVQQRSEVWPRFSVHA